MTRLLYGISKKPYYCEVEHLESTGTQWLDIDTTFNSTTDEVEFYFQLTDTANYKWIFGEHDNNARLGLGTGDGTNKRNVAYGGNTTKVSDTAMYNSQHYFMANSTGVYLNGTKIANYSSFVSTSTLYLFNLNLSPYTYGCKGKAWAYRHKRNGVLIKDLIPVLDWNMNPAMYDKVNRVFHYNQGSGTFSYGREIHYVDYLEATGTQYINTGLLSTANSKVDCTFGFTSMESSATNNCAIFGGRNNTTSTTFTMFKLASGNLQYFRFDFNGQPQVATANQMAWNTTSKYRFEYDGTNCITTNTTTGESVTTTRAPGSTFTTSPITLFAVNTNNQAGQFMKGCIHKYWYTDGTNTIDLHPAIDENGVGFMFDAVKHTILDNAGTGAFKYPPVQLEYIKSTGTQIINTGLKGKNGYDFEYDVNFTELSSSSATGVGGCYESQKSCYFGLVRTNKKFAYHYKDTSSPIEIQTMTANTDYTISGHLYSGSQYFTINGVTGGVGAITGDFTSTLDMWLMGVNSSTPLYSKMKFKKGWIKHNGTMQRDYIAAYKDGVAGLWDKENSVMYSNAGTGSFVVGKIVESEPTKIYFIKDTKTRLIK